MWTDAGTLNSAKVDTVVTTTRVPTATESVLAAAVPAWCDARNASRVPPRGIWFGLEVVDMQADKLEHEPRDGDESRAAGGVLTHDHAGVAAPPVPGHEPHPAGHDMPHHAGGHQGHDKHAGHDPEA